MKLIDTWSWPAQAAARRAVVVYIGWYNTIRLDSIIGYRRPGRIRDLN